MSGAAGGDLASVAIGMAIHVDNVISGGAAELAHRYAHPPGAGSKFVLLRVRLRLQGVPWVSDSSGNTGGGSVGEGAAR